MAAVFRPEMLDGIPDRTLKETVSAGVGSLAISLQTLIERARRDGRVVEQDGWRLVLDAVCLVIGCMHRLKVIEVGTISGDILDKAICTTPGPCPECGADLRGKEMCEGGGEACTKCSYWFCY